MSLGQKVIPSPTSELCVLRHEIYTSGLSASVRLFFPKLSGKVSLSATFGAFAVGSCLYVLNKYPIVSEKHQFKSGNCRINLHKSLMPGSRSIIFVLLLFCSRYEMRGYDGFGSH